jgi:hypothetical protein
MQVTLNPSVSGVSHARHEESRANSTNGSFNAMLEAAVADNGVTGSPEQTEPSAPTEVPNATLARDPGGLVDDDVPLADGTGAPPAGEAGVAALGTGSAGKAGGSQVTNDLPPVEEPGGGETNGGNQINNRPPKVTNDVPKEMTQRPDRAMDDNSFVPVMIPAFRDVSLSPANLAALLAVQEGDTRQG